jgi:hypothetical protein
MTTPRSQQLLFVINGGNGGHCPWKPWLMAATAMVVFVDGSRCQQRQQWDGGTMTQWHLQWWCLWLMVAEAMAVVVVNCAEGIDATTTIPSLASTAVAKMQSPPPPLTTASIDNNCYCRLQWPPLPLPYSRQSMVAAVFIDGNSNGEGRRGWERMRVQGQRRKGGGKGGKGRKGKGDGEGG